MSSSDAGTTPEVKAAGWRKKLPSRKSLVPQVIRRGSSAQDAILKPSELKKLRQKNRRQSSGPSNSGGESNSQRGGGASDVMRQIAEMRSKLAAKTEERLHDERQLQEVIDELLQTEHNYREDVRHCCDAYSTPLRPLIDAQTHDAIFANLEMLRGLHTKLGSDLSPRRGGSAEQEGASPSASSSPSTPAESTLQKAERVADAFMKLLPFFKMYSQYCHVYATAGETLEHTRETKRGVRDLIDAAQSESGSLLESLLFRPVQRMCQYPLLFKQALKHLEKGSELHARFTEVFDTVETTIAQVNEGVRRADEQARTARVLLHVADLKAKEKELLLSASNTLVHEMDLEMKLVVGRVAWGPQWRLRRAYKWCDTPHSHPSFFVPSERLTPGLLHVCASTKLQVPLLGVVDGVPTETPRRWAQEEPPDSTVGARGDLVRLRDQCGQRGGGGREKPRRQHQLCGWRGRGVLPRSGSSIHDAKGGAHCSRASASASASRACRGPAPSCASRDRCSASRASRGGGTTAEPPRSDRGRGRESQGAPPHAGGGRR
jgi:hypothetical protein